MKKLYILRHAEPDRSEEYDSDFDYPLSKRGKVDVKALAATLKYQKVQIDLIIASSAQRTLETAKAMAGALDCGELVRTKELYCADKEQIAKFVRGTNDKIHSLMIVGHNPSVTEFIDHFSDQVINWMKPCDLMVLEVPESSWQDFKSGIIGATYTLDEL